MSILPKHPSISVRLPQPTTASPNHTTVKEDIATEYDGKIGQRVIIPTLNNMTGVLRYVGAVDFKPGIWAGIELDEKGAGKNDGSAQGKRYFECPANSGIFISVNKIIIQAFSSNSSTTHSSSTSSNGTNNSSCTTPISTTSSTVITRKSNLPLTKRHSAAAATDSGLVKPKYTSKTPTQASSHASVIPTTTSASRKSRIGMTRQSTTPATHASSSPSSSFTGGRPSQSPSPYHHRLQSPSPSNPSKAQGTSKYPLQTSNHSTPSHRRSMIVTTNTAHNTSSMSSATGRSSITPRSTTTTPKPIHLQKANLIPLSSSPKENHTTPTPSHDTLSSAEADTLYDMLQKTQQERDTLISQMARKEAAWERLVSAKESLALQVEEHTHKNQHLTQKLAAAESEVEMLQQNLADRDASLAQTQRDEEQQSHQLKRITRLESLVRELQEEIKQKDDSRLEMSREHVGQMEQSRKELKEREAQCASLEKECEELRRAGLEAIQAYDQSVGQLKQEHEIVLQKKNYRIQQLEYLVADLRHKQSTLFHDDDDDDLSHLYGGTGGDKEERRRREFEAKLRDIQQTTFGDKEHLKNLQQQQQSTGLSNGNHSVISPVDQSLQDEDEETMDQRHRLEEQLELAMAELDNDRRTIETLQHEIEQLKGELQQSRQQTLAMEEKYGQLQGDFEKELNDKKRLIEEADDAFEAHAKAEDEHYQIKLSNLKMEKEYQELQEAHQRLEQNYNELMDEMLALEKQNLDQDSKSNLNGNQDNSEKTVADDSLLQKKIRELEKEKETYQHDLEAEKRRAQQLSKDLTELESLVENRVFGEADLEEKLEAEKKKVRTLERELAILKEDMMNSNAVDLHS